MVLNELFRFANYKRNITLTQNTSLSVSSPMQHQQSRRMMFTFSFIFLGEENPADNTYRYLTVDEMKSLGDDSMPMDPTHDEMKRSGPGGQIIGGPDQHIQVRIGFLIA